MTEQQNDINWLPTVAQTITEFGQTSSADALFQTLAKSLLRITGATVVEVDLLNAPHSKLKPVISLHSDRTPSTLHLASIHADFAQTILQQPHLITSAMVDVHGVEDLQAGTLAGIPLTATQTEGAVLLAFHKLTKLDQIQIQTTELLVQQAANRLYQLRITAEEQRKTSHLALLNTVSGLASSQQRPAVLIDHILTAILETFKLDTLVVYSGSPMIVSHAIGTQGPTVETILSAGLARISLEEGHTLLSNDIEQDQRCTIPKWASQRLFAEIAAPLGSDGQYIGVLDAYCTRPERFDMLDLQTFSTLAQQLTFVLRRRRSGSLTAVSSSPSAPLPILADTRTTRLFLEGMASLAEAAGADHAILYKLHDHMLQESLKWPEEGRLLSKIVDDTDSFSLAQECLAFHKPLMTGRIQGLSWSQSSTRPNLKRGACLAIPLGKAREESAVVVLIFSRTPRFSAEQSETLNVLLNLLASQAQTVHQSENLNLRVQQFSLLYTIAANTHTLTSPLEVIMETAEKLRTSMQWQSVEIFQWDSAHRRFTLLGKRRENTVVRPNQDALFEQVRRNMEPIIWNPKGTRPLGELYTHSAEMAVPMMQNGKLRGLIYAKGSAKQRFTAVDSEFLHQVANLLGDTLNNIAVYARLRQQLQEALTLNQIHKTIDYSADLEAVLQRIIETVFKTMHCYGAHIATLTDDLSALIVRAQTGFTRSHTVPQRYVLRGSLFGQVAENQKSLSLVDVQALSDSLYGIPEVQSILAVPLINANQETIGVLAVAGDQNATFSRTDEHLLNVAAGQISMVIENLQLYEDLELRSDRLKQAYQKLQDFTELKEQILQNVSHELRTPLTMVKGYVELLVAEDLGNLNEKQREALETIVTRTDDMVDIIKQVVAVRPLGETNNTFTCVAVDKLLSDVVAFISYRAGNTDITISLDYVDPELLFFGDAEKIRHICVNLMDNAVKFSPDGGHIEVTAQENGPYVHITISDQGIGIPDQKLNRIFETFYQVDGSSTRAFGGLGLGLTAVHNLVQQLSGKIWVESEVDEGSVFHVKLPRADQGTCAILPED